MIMIESKFIKRRESCWIYTQSEKRTEGYRLTLIEAVSESTWRSAFRLVTRRKWKDAGRDEKYSLKRAREESIKRSNTARSGDSAWIKMSDKDVSSIFSLLSRLLIIICDFAIVANNRANNRAW